MGIIGSIRKHSWIAVAIVGIAIIAFIVGDFTKRNGGNNEELAEVNGETLNHIQFNNMIQQEENIRLMIKEAMGDPNPKLTPDEEKYIRDSIWANYMDDIVIGEQLKKLGLEVSEAEVNDMYTGTFIHPIFAQQFRDENGQYDIARVSSLMKSYSQMDTVNRYFWNSMKDQAVKQRLRQKYVTLINSGFYMPSPIAKQIASYSAQGASVSVVRMSYADVPDSELMLTDADYQNYYNSHKERYRNLNDERRVLKYVTFDILPSEKDYQVAKDSAMAAWDKLQATPDSNPRALGNLVKMESRNVKRYSYDSTYNHFLRASYFPSPFSEMVAASEEGSELVPTPIANNWFMGRVMEIENRPDSIRTSMILILSDNWNPNVGRDTARAEFLTDSLLSELNAGRLDFDTAVTNFSDVKLTLNPEKTGDAQWQNEGSLDRVYNSFFERPGERATIFNGLNEQVVKVAEGNQIRFDLPNKMGFAIVKVTGKSALVKKYRLACIVQEVRPSKQTEIDIQNDAYKFLTDSRGAAGFEKTVNEQKKQPFTVEVSRMDDHINYLDNARDVVKWAFAENTKIGDVNGDVVSLGNVYAVVMLQDVYQKGYFTLAQVRSMTRFNFEQDVRAEKRKDILMARAEKVAKSCKNIEDVATSLNATVEVIDTVSLRFSSNNMYGIYDIELQAFGNNNGVEGKMEAMVVASKSNGLMGPVKGSNGVYFVQVNNRFEMPQAADPEQIRISRERFSQISTGMMWGSRFLPMDCQAFLWLRANANIEDHRDRAY